MKQIEINNHYKVLRVEIPAGKDVPRHYATFDAFIMVNSGNALLIFSDETIELKKDSYFSITANRPHTLRIVEDFKAWIVLANDAEIKYPNINRLH